MKTYCRPETFQDFIVHLLTVAACFGARYRLDKTFTGSKSYGAATTPIRLRKTTQTSNIAIIPISSTAVAIEIGPVVPFIIMDDLWKLRRTVRAGSNIIISKEDRTVLQVHH